MYQTMSRSIDLYGQGVAAMKKLRDIADDLAEKLELPSEALGTAAKLSITGGRRALIENHKGIIEYGRERIVIGTEKGRIVISGHELLLSAMNKSELLITGKINMAEWE